MARKSRTRQRREAAALPPAKIARPAPPSAQRSTFRVAQAQRELAAALPTVVRNRSAERRSIKPAPLDAAPLSDPVPQSDTNRAKPLPSKRRTTTQPTLANPPKSGVCRPRGGPKSGGGADRSFVPFKDCR